MAPNTLSATASGAMACWTWLRMTSVRLMLNTGPVTFWPVSCSYRCSRLVLSAESCRCRPGIPAAPWVRRSPIHA